MCLSALLTEASLLRGAAGGCACSPAAAESRVKQLFVSDDQMHVTTVWFAVIVLVELYQTFKSPDLSVVS